ncbi:hypothetical protein DB88DRAFT_537450 [Papiliotrema laurentii]|uniref:Methyltransferase domain-containing protein n=1 Tax=Papiliotrema laurentii TaxID=5418 RepID=A0AAD9FWY1_PAPLA|nr:hypothetical protein DB88DRAFT_537450 [Papiliotrema laurentii]
MFRSESRSSTWGSCSDISTEPQRLEIMNTVHNTLLNPYASQMVHQHLAMIHTRGRRSRVLDVGAGTGSWACDVADKNPFCDVIAVDNDWSKFAGRASLHGNVDFATLGGYRSVPGAHRQTSALRSHGQPAALVCLTIQDTRHGALTPDLIHVKTLLLEMPDYPTLLQRLAILLRRGGLLVVIESEPMFIPRCGGESSQALSIWNACVRDAYCARGVDVTLPRSLSACLSASGVFIHPAYTQEVGIPTAGYIRSASSALAKAGRLHYSVIEANLRYLLPTVLAHGYSRAEIMRLMADVLNELTHPSSTHHQRLYAVYVRKA